MYQIQIKDNYYYEESFILENQIFKFVFKWNERAKIWSLDINDNENKPILTGRNLVLNTNILKNVKSSKKPGGFLLVLPLSENIKEITRDNILTDIGIFYLSKQELIDDPDWNNLNIFS